MRGRGRRRRRVGRRVGRGHSSPRAEAAAAATATAGGGAAERATAEVAREVARQEAVAAAQVAAAQAAAKAGAVREVVVMAVVMRVRVMRAAAATVAAASEAPVVKVGKVALGRVQSLRLLSGGRRRGRRSRVCSHSPRRLDSTGRAAVTSHAPWLHTRRSWSSQRMCSDCTWCAPAASNRWRLARRCRQKPTLHSILPPTPHLLPLSAAAARGCVGQPSSCKFPNSGRLGS